MSHHFTSFHIISSCFQQIASRSSSIESFLHPLAIRAVATSCQASKPDAGGLSQLNSALHSLEVGAVGPGTGRLSPGRMDLNGISMGSQWDLNGISMGYCEYITIYIYNNNIYI